MSNFILIYKIRYIYSEQLHKLDWPIPGSTLMLDYISCRNKEYILITERTTGDKDREYIFECSGLFLSGIFRDIKFK